MAIRYLVQKLTLQLDRCGNTYGVAPCTAAGAAGTECYNCFATCQDKPNFNRVAAGFPLKFAPLGTIGLTPGELVRPYIVSIDRAPTEIDIDKGLARRSSSTVVMADPTASDVGMDPYVRTRPTPVQGTFWPRLQARHPNAVGRPALIESGFYNGSTLGATITERYVVDTIKGPTVSGQLTLTLKDPAKLLDRSLVPAATKGKVAVELKAFANRDVAVGATLTTIQLNPNALAVDDGYNGFEVYIVENTGQGQRRIITDYDGATRTATVAGWAVIPDGTSLVEVSALAIQLNAGEAAQYNDPVVTGMREFVRVGDEIIEYMSIAGDALLFTSSAARAQFGSLRKDHDLNDSVQLCWARIRALFTDVAIDLFLASGYDAADIDLAEFASEDSIWLGDPYRVTVCLSDPEQPSDMLTDLLPQANAVSWWDPREQQQKFRIMLPRLVTPATYNDSENFIAETVDVQTQDDLRVTFVAINFGIADATANRDEAKFYLRAEGAVDADAESDAEYGDSRPLVVYSRWFDETNTVAMRAWVLRMLIARRDAPKRITCKLDPRDNAIRLADEAIFNTSALVGFDGANKNTRVFITRVDDLGDQIELAARTVSFDKKYGFIGANGIGNYPSDSTWAHISDNAGLMGNGDDAYLII